MRAEHLAPTPSWRAGVGLMLGSGLTLGGVLGHSTLALGLASAILALLWLSDARTWLASRSGGIAILMAMVAVALGSVDPRPATEMGLAVLRFLDVIVFLLAISFLRLPLSRARLQEVLPAVRAGGNVCHRLRVLSLFAFLLSALVSIGAVALLAALRRERGDDAHDTALATTRGVAASMLWAPSFAPVALVMQTFPTVSWYTALGFGVPLAGIAMGLTLWHSPSGQAMETADEAGIGAGTGAPGVRHVLLLIGAFAAILCGGVLLGLGLTLAIALAALLSGVLTIVLLETGLRRSLWPVVWHDADAVWARLAPEVALFGASGMLSVVLTGPYWNAPAQHFLAGLGLPAGIWLGGITLLAPLLTALGLHAIVPFSILAPLLGPALTGLAIPQLYAAWTLYWMLALLISPVSILNLTAAGAFSISPWSLALRHNATHAVSTGVLGTALIYWLPA